MAHTSKNTKILISIIVTIFVVVTLVGLLLSISRPSFNNSQAASCSDQTVDSCLDNDTQLLCRGGNSYTYDCMPGYSCVGGVCQKYTSGALPGNE